MISACYAFRSKEHCEETLEEHLAGVVKCVEERWEFNGLVRKVSRLTGVKGEIIGFLVRLSAFLHDVGKAQVGIQSDCRKRYCEEFQYHYVVSAMFAYKLGVESGVVRQRMEEKLRRLLVATGSAEQVELDIEGLYLTIVVLPVLLHHYAGIGDSSIENGLKTTSLLFEIDGACRESLLNAYKYLEQNTPQELATLGDEFKELVNSGIVELGVLQGVTSFLRSYEPSFAKALVEAVTGLLNMCDGIVAGINRSRRRTCSSTKSTIRA